MRPAEPLGLLSILAMLGMAHAAPPPPSMACLRDAAAAPAPLTAPCETPGAEAVRTFSERIGVGRHDAALAGADATLRNGIRDPAGWARADHVLRDPADRVACRHLRYAEGDAAAASRAMTVELVHASGAVLREQYRVVRGADSAWRVADYRLERLAPADAARVACGGAATAAR